MKHYSPLPAVVRPRPRSPIAILLAAIAIIAFPPETRAVLVDPGDTQPLSGTSPVINPDLGGVVLRDPLHPFTIRDRLNNILVSGSLQERVVRSSNLGTLIFTHRLRNLSAPGSARIVRVERSGFRRVTTDVDFSVTGVGDVGPDSVTRSSDGDRLSFRHDPSFIVPPDEGRFTFALTEAPDFDLTGSITIYAKTSPAAPEYSVTIENVSAPGVLEVNPGQSIQWAIDHADPGDTVTVAPGTYTEDLTLRSEIDVQGSGAEDTILNGTGTGDVVTATSVNGMEFSGFTIQGSGTGNLDAGIEVANSNIVVRNNTITGNTLGILTINSASFICSNLITGNGYAGNIGTDYGIRCSGSDLFAGNRIVQNLEGGVLCLGTTAAPQFVNNTISDNGATGFQAAGATPILKNTILSGNTGRGIFSENDAVVESSYNCIFGNSFAYTEIRGGTITSRLGDILVDPEFDLSQPDAYFLAETSPCIDAGDPAAIYNDLDGSRNDIGATGGLCGSETPPGSIISGFVWTSVGTYANITEIEQSGAKRGLTTDRDRPFGGRPWLYGAFGTTDTPVSRYAVKIARWTGPTPPGDEDFDYRDDPLSKTRYDISGGTLAAETVALGPVTVAGRPTYALTRNSGNIFWAHENLRLQLRTAGLENGTYSVRMEGLNLLGVEVPLAVNNDLVIRVNNTRPTVSIDAVSFGGGAPFDECSIIDLPGPTSTLNFVFTASHADGFLDNFILDVLIGRNRSGGRIDADSYPNHLAPDAVWNGVNMKMVNATPVSPEQPLPNLQLWETCAYQFRLRAWARTTNGFNRIYHNMFFDNYAIDLEGPVICTPDLDGDGDVDAQDLAIMAEAYGRAND